MSSDPRDRAAARSRLDRAWERFVAGGEPSDVRPEIARSWRRSRDVYRVDPAIMRSPTLPADELALRRAEDDALEVARPVLDQFAAGLGDGGHVVAFFDADGWLLDLGGDPEAAARLGALGFAPGVSLREEALGTSGPGTALAERRPTEVFASEHWARAWHDWTSASAPIGAAGSRELVALVDVTGPWDARDPQGLVAATAIAAVVEERLRARQSVRDEIVRFAMRAARAWGDALVAVDARGQVLQVSEAATRGLALEEGQLPRELRARVAALLRARETADEDLPLEWPGPERRQLTCAAVRHDGRDVGAILRLLPQAARAGRGGPRPGAPPPGRDAFRAILGRSEKLRAALDLAQVAARNDLPVVLYGESGTGKELFAQGIHAASARAAKPLVALNCGAIPAALIEAELFGYEPGTFTGGHREGKPGKLEEADGGTLFLDEVAELPPQAQTALLRVLQQSEVVRLGGSRTRPVDVRIVAATNRRLDGEVAAGRFRHDLFFRLNVLSLIVPPLRERVDDVPLLARAFLAEAEERTGRSGLALSEGAAARLARHAWTGNVRELRNVILRAAAVAASAQIEADDLLLVELPGFGGRLPTCSLKCQPDPSAPCLQGHGGPCEAAGGRAEPVVLGGARAPLAPAWSDRREPVPLNGAAADGAAEPDADGAAGDVAEAEEPGRDELVAALDASGWNIARTASSLGVSRMTLYRRLRRFGISR